jgi:hypothetical protein
VQFVEVVPRDGVAREFGHDAACTVTPIVHVPGCSALPHHRVHLDAVLHEQVASDASRLAGERRDHRDAPPERLEHARLPDALPSGMDVQVGSALVALDRHREQWRRCEHEYVCHRYLPPTTIRTRCSATPRVSIDAVTS